MQVRGVISHVDEESVFQKMRLTENVLQVLLLLPLTQRSHLRLAERISMTIYFICKQKDGSLRIHIMN